VDDILDALAVDPSAVFELTREGKLAAVLISPSHARELGLEVDAS
jgi:hypothetical protein